MRPVMMAIWTSGEPVSLSWRWYWVMNWVLTSFARGMTYASFLVFGRSPCPQPKPQGRPSHEPRLYQLTLGVRGKPLGHPAAGRFEHGVQRDAVAAQPLALVHQPVGPFQQGFERIAVTRQRAAHRDGHTQLGLFLAQPGLGHRLAQFLGHFGEPGGVQVVDQHDELLAAPAAA